MAMSRVLLILPTYGKFFQRIKGLEWIAPPIGLAYLASVLEKSGHEVKIFDMQIEKKSLNKVLNSFKPDIVGVSSSTPAFNDAINILHQVKKFNPNIKTIIGGPHPSALPKETAAEPCVDIVVYGEGEITLNELVNNHFSLKNCKGIAYKKKGKVAINKIRPPIINLDSLPFPAYHLLSIEKYYHPLMKDKRIMSILTSRGCPFNCIYCNKNIFGHAFRERSAVNVVDEIEFLIENYKIEEFHIIDDNFTLNRKHAIDVCKEIIRRNLDIKWATPNGIRADTISNNLIRLMKRSGCYSVLIGVESGSSRILRSIGKNITLDKIKRAFKICKEEKLETTASLVIGLPGETPDDLRKTIEFTKKLQPDVADFHMLIPLPGTPVYNYLKQNGLIIETDWSKYSFHTEPVFRTKELTKEEILEWYKRAYREFYMNPKYIFGRLMKMKSISDVRANLRGLSTILQSFVLRK